MTGRHDRRFGMRHWRRSAVVTLSAALAVGVWGSAAAAEDLVISQPNGDFGVWVFTGSVTDRDRDGSVSTATYGDNVGASYTPYSRIGVTQTIRIEWVLDGPGTELDRTGTNTITLAPAPAVSPRVVAVGFDVQKNTTPLGEYRFTFTATGSGTETATTTGTFTGQAKK